MAEKENFCRFFGILLDIGAKVLREFFLDKYVGTNTLAGYLAFHKKHLTGLIPNPLRKDQFDLLYPSGGGAPVIEDYDITLLYLLFRNLDTQSVPNDHVWTDPKTRQSYQADVTRIKLERNILFGHVKSALMSNTTYNNEVINLTTIYHRLAQQLSAGRMSSTDLQEMKDRELNDPLQKSLDREVKHLKEGIQEWYKHDEDFKKAVQARQEDFKKAVQARQEDFEKAVQARQEDFEKAVEARQEDFEKAVQARHEDFEKAVQARQEDFEKAVQARQEDFEKAVEARQEDFEKAVEARQEDFEKAVEARQEDFEKAVKAVEARQEDFEKAVEVRQEDFEKAVQARQEDFEKAVQARQEDFEKAVQARQEDFEKAVEAKQEDFEKAVEAKQEDFEKAVNAVEARQEDFEKALEARQEDFEKAVQARQEDFEKAVQARQEDFEKAVQARQEDFEKAVEAKQEDFEKAVEAKQEDFEKAVEAKQEDFEKAVEARQEDFEKAVQARQEEIQKHVKEFSEKQEDMKKDIKYLLEEDIISTKVKYKDLMSENCLLQPGQLEKSRQWDSLSRGRENEQVAMGEMRRRIDCSKEVLDKHKRHAGEFFIENQRYRMGKNILDLQGKILITGKAGQGKTCLAYQLLLKCLEDKKHVSPLIISSADEWKKLADSSTDLCIVVDDMCGKHGLLQGELKKWNENARFIAALLDNKKHTVIFTMRTHIYEEIAGGLQLESDFSDPIFKNITLNLESDSMNLSEADKIQFANRYLTKFGLTEDEVLELCRINEVSIGFPLLCRSAESIEDKSKLIDLFTSPLQIMLTELNCLLMQKSISYGSLVLAMLAGGTLTSVSINEYSTTSDRKKEIKLIFCSYAGPDVKLAEIQQAANALCGTYLSFNECDESYSFVHDVVEEALFISYGKLHLQETLKLCSLRSVCKLCRINNESQSSKAISPALMLDLPPIHHGILIERFIKALDTKSHGDFATIAEANVWSSDQFRKLFMNKCKKIHLYADTDQNSLLVHAANVNNCDLASELLRGMKQIRAEDQQQAVSFLTEATKASCIHKDLCLFKQFMETGNVNGNDIISFTVKKGAEEAMVFLLQNGADINFRSENGESLLHTACLHGRLHIVKVLQSKYSLSVNQCDSEGRSVCHSSASGGSVDILNFLVKEGADPLCKDFDEMNLLHYACLEGKKEMAFHLMQNYSNMLYDVGKGGYTVPHCAAYGGCIDIFKRLCKLMNTSARRDCNNHTEETTTHHQNQVHIKARTKIGETILHMACLSGKLEMTKYLVEKYPDMINEVNKHNATLAHYAAAAEGGSFSVLQFLLAQGVDPWCRTVKQNTLLHLSCISSRLEITKYLLEKYPDMIKEVDTHNRTPAHYAALGSKVSHIQHLIDQGQDLWCGTSTQHTLLNRSSINRQLEIIKCLANKSPDIINQVDINKATTGHFAAGGGNASVLQYLIGQGLDPWCRTSAQLTLLHWTCISGHLEMTQYLVEKYPGMTKEVDNCKRTPAHSAAHGGNVSVLQYLIGQGLDPWCRTSTQETLLHMSCIAGRLEMTQYLVEKYPDMIKEVDNCKRTPAHNSAHGGNVSVLQYLIDQGLDPWCTPSTQETLLHMSCIAGRLEMTQYLVEKYPDMIKEVDNCKGTPAHDAAHGGNVSVLQYLIGQGLDPWCRTSTQETLLHRSCIAGRLEMTQYLVEKYPDMIKEVDNCKRTPAHDAAHGGNVSVLQYLIDEGLDPWCRTSTQETLLHRSCIAGRLEMTQYLIEKYPDMIKEVDNCKGTPAHDAAHGGNVFVLQYLIDQGLDTWCRTSTQETLLHRSCIAGRLEMTQYLVQKYPDMIKEVDNCKGTPAHYSAHGGNVSLLQYLIDQGLDPWCRTSTQETLLHRSCIAGRLEMTQYLVEKYPDMIKEVDNCKGTPAHDAAHGGNVSILQYLIGQGLDPWCRTSTQETLLHRSCIAGRLEMTQYLVEKYPDMNKEVDNCKGTPAHDAAHGGNVSVLQYLIGQGLDPWCRTSTQETLLHRSCIAGRLEMTQYLVEKYPDMIKEVDNCKRTPAHSAAHGGSVSLLQYLIDQGLDPWCRTSNQETLLHKSCITGRLEITQYLLEKYPDMIHMVDNMKATPAHSAARSGNISVLQYLIGQGLDPWCRTSTQETLLHRSCIAGQLEMTQYLVEKYPDMIKEVDNCKQTPAHYSACGGNVSVLQYLIGQGLDPWCRTSTKGTLLHMSCIFGHLEMTQYLVEKYPDMIKEVDRSKRTPVFYAFQSSNASVLLYLNDQDLY